ncbi:MAG: DUF350 domain-containing protein [Gemmatimonadetes bacterium]|jgi:uncharacterized membrane protein YjfL (UPF0719 family)|nr:DUF350 domain-containing protein [Gemmatimonadota bacterium]
MVEEYLVPIARTVVDLLEAFVLLWIAKIAYTSIYRRVDLKAELFERNNHALAISTTGYLFGIVIALGGVLVGPSAGWQADLTVIAIFGLQAIVLMLIAGFLCEKILLPHFDNTKEVVQDHNAGTAFVEAGMHIANGLIVLAINQGTGEWWIGLVFWGLAQLVLLLVGRLYEAITSHSIHEELERDNAAVGLAFGGLLVGMGNIISIAVTGDFLGWSESLQFFAGDALFGLVILFLIKKLTDAILAPGIRLGDEQIEEKPNVGAGLLEAFGYVGGSMLIVWVF